MNFIKRLLGLPRNLYPQELDEAQGLYRLVNGERFKWIQIKNNTALIPGGQKLAEQKEAIVKLLEEKWLEYLKNLLGRLGYPMGSNLSLDLRTGKVYKIGEVNPQQQPVEVKR